MGSTCAPGWAHGEADVRMPILECLSGGGVLTTAEITRGVRRKLGLQPSDLQRANKRSSEQKIDQIIANALQDGRYLCKMRFIEREGAGTFRLTALGKVYIKKFEENVAFASAWLAENYPDID